MVVRTNVMAINAYRQLGMNNSAVGKSLEKLSSGFRINRAGDDASGLAISEKMKAQIKGLDTAVANAQDGISLIQTAEGSLIEVHDMLNRMVELCGKAANGTMDDSVDRPALQEEITALKDEINRIAQGTNFNGIELLDGSLGGAASISTTPASATGAATAAVYSFDMAGATATTGQTFEFGGATITEGAEFNATDSADDIATAMRAALTTAYGSDYTIGGTGTAITLTAKTPGADSDFATMSALTVDGTGTVSNAAITANDGAAASATGAVTTVDFTGKTGANMLGTTLTVGGTTYEFYDSAAGTYDGSNTGIDVAAAATSSAIATAFESAINGNVSGAATAVDVTNTSAVNITTTATAPDTAPIAVTSAGGGLTLQVGDTAANYNQITVAINDMSCEGLGIDKIDISTQQGAKEALNLLKNKGVGSTSDGGLVGTEGCGAINIVSTQRAKLGALQNRLEHTINNLQVTSENMTAANSRIRDTDMAKEMMNYTKMNVLSQAAQAMLAQANMQPQSVLQLLQ